MITENNQSKFNYLIDEYDFRILSSLDAFTSKHSFKVAYYALRFFKSVSTWYDLTLVYYAGLYHDIGKSLIDKEILNKPTGLTRDEFAIMKGHTELGYSMLKKAGLPKEILDAARYHHERFDGKGYPLGLKGTKIPLLARIISICDVFDALTSNRPYRKAYSQEEALEIMAKMSDHFDPDLLSAFMAEITTKMYYSDLMKRPG